MPSASALSSEVDPVTEHTSLPLRSSTDLMSLSFLHQQLLAGDEVGAGLADDSARRSSVME